MSAPEYVPAEPCVLCGSPVEPDGERCSHCDLWVAVDGPGRRRRLPRNAVIGMAAGIVGVWLVTYVVAAIVG